MALSTHQPMVPLSPVLVLVLASSSLHGALIEFSDSGFADADWSMQTITGGGGGNVVAAQVANGNPGPSREVTHTVLEPGPAQTVASHMLSQATHDPGADGAILSIDFSVHCQNGFSTNPDAPRQYFGMGVLQDGSIYVVPWVNSGSSPGWQVHESEGLTDEDFVMLSPPSPSDITIDWSSHPDFTAYGSELVIGFVTWRADDSPGGVTDVETVQYDNFYVGLTVVPEPVSFALLALGGLPVLLRRPSAGPGRA